MDVSTTDLVLVSSNSLYMFDFPEYCNGVRIAGSW